MKFYSFIIIVSLLCCVFAVSCNNFKIDTNEFSSIPPIEGSFKLFNEVNYHSNDNEYVIYGNYTDFDSELLYSLTHDREKICIFYDLDLSDNANDKLEIMRNNAVIYYYKDNIPYVNSYISNSTTTEELIYDINNYVNEVLEKMKTDKKQNSIMPQLLSNTRYVDDNASFDILYAGSFRDEEKPYGYIDCDYIVSKYRANDVSSLYIIESDMSFVPGAVAQSLGSYGYENWNNASGYAKIKALRASNEVGINQVRYGGTPVFKDAYPVNSPGQITIASSYTEGLTMGYSQTNGFSLYDINIESGSSSEYQIIFNYNKAYTGTEPAMSAQKDPDDTQKYTWLYTYSTPRNETYHLSFGYMFEMNNRGHHLLEGDLAFEYDYKMIVSRIQGYATETQYFIGYMFHNYY